MYLNFRRVIAAAIILISPNLTQAATLVGDIQLAVPGAPCSPSNPGNNASGSCSSAQGNSNASANATAGTLAGTANATHLDAFNSVPAIGNSHTNFSGTVIFSSSNSLMSAAPVSLNVNLSGTMNTAPL